jgi:hypothetical protein
MMRVLVVVAATACASSERELEAPDAGVAGIDAAHTMDSSSGLCELVVDKPGSSVDRGRVGSTGGSKGPMLECDDPFREQIIGISLQMSNQATVFGGRSAQGMAIACARVTIDPSGGVEVGDVKTKSASGTGTNGWSPSTWTPMTECKPGWVVSGLLAHLGSTNNRFLDVTMTCSRLSPSGKAIASESLKITGSLTDTANPDQVKCAPGEVVQQLGTFTGAGLDAVAVYCSAPACL